MVFLGLFKDWAPGDKTWDTGSDLAEGMMGKSSLSHIIFLRPEISAIRDPLVSTE